MLRTIVCGAISIFVLVSTAAISTHQLQVEFVSSLSVFQGLTQSNVKLPGGIIAAGDLQVTITVNGRKSNVVLVGVKP